MQTDKIVLRAVLSTLIAIAVLFGIMLLVLCFIFPSTMMQITYRLGMEESSIRNARRAYKTSSEAYYMAFATEVAIGVGNDAEVVRCGDVLISNNTFIAYCEIKDKELKQDLSYRDYMYGQVCLAKYRLGNKEQAINKAFSSLENTFPENNAVVVLLLTALSKNDLTTVNSLQTKLTQLQASVDKADEPYLQTMLDLIDD